MVQGFSWGLWEALGFWGLMGVEAAGKGLLFPTYSGLGFKV